jgi:hypothetical protein
MPEIPFHTALRTDTLPLRTLNGTEHKVSTPQPAEQPRGNFPKPLPTMPPRPR